MARQENPGRDGSDDVAALNRRSDTSYIVDIIRILLPYDAKGLDRSVVLARVKKSREMNGLAIPANFESCVKHVVQTHSSESPAFKGFPEDDIFFWPAGKRGGKWAVRRGPALARLRKSSFRLPGGRPLPEG